MAAETDADASARTQFYTQSFTIFTSLQSIAASQQQEDRGEDTAAWLAAGPSVQTMQYYYRIGTLYCDTLQTYIDALDADASSDAEYLKHIQTLQTIFHLAQVLYFPEDGRGMGVLGEELLHWLNAHDVGTCSHSRSAHHRAGPADCPDLAVVRPPRILGLPIPLRPARLLHDGRDGAAELSRTGRVAHAAEHCKRDVADPQVAPALYGICDGAGVLLGTPPLAYVGARLPVGPAAQDERRAVRADLYWA